MCLREPALTAAVPGEGRAEPGPLPPGVLQLRRRGRRQGRRHPRHHEEGAHEK